MKQRNDVFITWLYGGAVSSQETTQNWSLSQHSTECAGPGRQTSAHISDIPHSTTQLQVVHNIFTMQQCTLRHLK